MNDKDQQRLAELQKEGFLKERLCRSDLLLLLKADPEVQEAIRQLVAYPETASQALLPPPEALQAFEEPPEYDPPSVAPPVPAARPAPVEDGLHAALAAELELLAWIDQDRELAQAWLGVEDDGERRVVRLIAVAAQWDRLLLLWDRLAARCKEEARPASPVERQILARCLALHNLIWQGRQASLQIQVCFESVRSLDYLDRGGVKLLKCLFEFLVLLLFPLFTVKILAW